MLRIIRIFKQRLLQKEACCASASRPEKVAVMGYTYTIKGPAHMDGWCQHEKLKA
jgi:hypothetical protein